MGLVLIYFRYFYNVRRFKKISTHEHYRKGGNFEAYVAAMQWANIEKAVFVPTDWPPSNPAYKEHLTELFNLKNKYPDKIIIFATAYNQDPEAAEFLENAIKKGAQGIKFIDWLETKKFPNDAGAINSDNMYKIYKLAEKYQIPLLMHIDCQKRPDWTKQLYSAAADFPSATFILPHYCRAASGKTPEIAICSDILLRFPNVYTDLSMGGGLKRYIKYFDENPNQFKDFIIQHQDKIMWGTDIILDGEPHKTANWIKNRMLTDFLIFSKNKYFRPKEPKDKNLHGGLALPKKILKKIYWENPKRILKI